MLIYIAMWKMSFWKCHILYDSNYLTSLWRQDYDGKKTSGCLRFGRKEKWLNRWNTGLLGPVKILWPSNNTWECVCEKLQTFAAQSVNLSVCKFLKNHLRAKGTLGIKGEYEQKSIFSCNIFVNPKLH